MHKCATWQDVPSAATRVRRNSALACHLDAHSRRFASPAPSRMTPLVPSCAMQGTGWRCTIACTPSEVAAITGQNGVDAAADISSAYHSRSFLFRSFDDSGVMMCPSQRDKLDRGAFSSGQEGPLDRHRRSQIVARLLLYRLGRAGASPNSCCSGGGRSDLIPSVGRLTRRARSDRWAYAMLRPFIAQVRTSCASLLRPSRCTISMDVHWTRSGGTPMVSASLDALIIHHQ